MNTVKLRNDITDKSAENHDSETALSAEKTLSILQSLHSSLDIQTTIEKFIEQISYVLPISGAKYENTERRLDLTMGEQGQNQISFQLNVNGEYLGKLTLLRNQFFTENDLNTIESCTALLLLPLSHAIEYHQALRSALTDPLTGINNRQSLNGLFPREIEIAKRHGHPLSMMLLDLDHFKKVNDQYGHATGDKVLIDFTESLKQTVRESDIIFRIGGEEFIILLSNTEMTGAIKLADRIRKQVELSVTSHEQHQLQYTVSIGVASFVAGDNESSLTAKADQALYRAKHEGRNRVSI